MGDEAKPRRHLAAILFTDIVGFSALTVRDEALTWLSTAAVKLRDTGLTDLKIDLLLNPLRGDARFPAIEKGLNIPPSVAITPRQHGQAATLRPARHPRRQHLAGPEMDGAQPARNNGVRGMDKRVDEFLPTPRLCQVSATAIANSADSPPSPTT